MKIFIIPSWYPTEDNPSTGIFFREQAVLLAQLRPNWSIGLSLWGSHEPRLWVRIKKPLSALIKLSSKSPLKKYQKILLPNCIEMFTPALTWNRHIAEGNQKGILEAQEENFRFFVEYFGMPDLIHAQVSFPAGYLAMQLSKRHKIPYVITEHMSPFPMPSLRSAMKKYLLPPLEEAGLVLAVSKGLQAQLENHGVASEQINNFIDQKVFYFHAKKEGLFTFLALGRLEKQKGYELLLSAAKKLVDKKVEFSLRIIGSGSQEASLRNTSEKLGLTSHVNWLGELSRDEVREELINCHCLVSTSHHENQPVAILEAMAVGRPVLTTAWQGSDELIRDPSLGEIADTRDPELFMNAMIEMANRYFDHKKIANIFEEYFSARKTVDLLEDKFMKVISV